MQANDVAAAPRSDHRPAMQAGLVGRGIQGSRSPRMHNGEGARLGLDYDYRLFDFDQLGLPDSELATVIAQARVEGYRGLNITHPFKECVVSFLDDFSPDAAAIGSVNTVVFQDGMSIGHNTDCWGFAESFVRGLSHPRLENVLLIGAGGAGMAVARALLGLGAGRLAIYDLDRAKAARLMESLCGRFGSERVGGSSDLEQDLAGADGLVNATPLGMAKYPGMPVNPRWLRPDLWVADIVYFPTETELLRAAAACGCRTLPGAGMAIFQAAKAFELITGVVPDPKQMARHFQAA